MQPLATTQLMMTWLSMCSADESTTFRERTGQIAHTLVVLILNVICFAASMTYCVKYFSIDFDGAALALMVAIGEFGVIYFIITAISMRHRIDGIFTDLSTIYMNNENEVTFRYLVRANEIGEWIVSFFWKYIAVTLAGFSITSLLSVLYFRLIQGDSSTKHFYRIAKHALPWNQTTHVGYFGEFCADMAFVYGYLILNWTPLLLFISLCIHHQAFYKMVKHSIDKSEKCDVKLLRDLIRFHISAKSLFSNSANVYSPFVFVQLACNVVYMTVSVFYLDLQWHHLDFTAASVMSSSVVGMTSLFIYCYFGELATKSYEKMPDCVFNMDWYDQPNEVQKYFILMIENMQKQLYYHGFEVAKLNLGTFINLFKKVFSYYIAIKTLASK